MTNAKPLRYLITKPGSSGMVRHFWQPTSKMRAEGLKLQRLSNDPLAAAAQAQVLNAEWDRIRVIREAASTRAKASVPQPGWETSLDLLGLNFIYVIGAEDGCQKVGITTDPRKRLGGLQHAHAMELRINFLASIPSGGDPRAIESAAHIALRRWHRRGEWFSCAPEEAIKSVLGALNRLMMSNQIVARRTSNEQASLTSDSDD